MSTHNHDVQTSSENPNWRTPQWLFDALNAEFHFSVDAAADAQTTKCPVWFGPGAFLDDALLVPWIDVAHTMGWVRPTIFVNPPYSNKLKRPIEPWVEQAAKAGESITTVAILPYATQTKWWAEFVYGPLYRAVQIRRFHHRISFDPPLGSGKAKLNANVNTAIVVWSPLGQQIAEPWVPHEFYWDVRPRGEK
jgi:site-specific DNA-methyltransferase (adenine-specific)